MTLLALETFNGLAPAIHPSKLGEGMAIEADNVRLDRGVLEPWSVIAYLGGTSYQPQSLFLYQGDFITSPYPRQYVNTLMPNDPYDFLFYTDLGYPKIRSGSAEYKLGLPRPGTPTPTVVNAGDKSNITDVQTFRYTVSIRDAWGNEGPSSPTPSVPVEVGKGFEVSLNLQNSGVSGNYNLGSGAVYYIYRSNSGTNAAGFQYVDAVPYGTASYTDTIPSQDLEEALPSGQWVAAPDNDSSLYPAGPLASLVEAPGGYLVGHSGNTVFMSEPYVPTAWPYYMASEAVVQAIAVIQGGIFCATDREPYLLAGSHPSAMVHVPIESLEPCVSPRSMVAMGGVAIYASPAGLVLAQGNSATLVTQDYFDERSWQDMQPETIRAFAYEGKYLAFYGDPADKTGFLFDPRGGRNTLTTFSGLGVSAGYYDVPSDTLYLTYLLDNFQYGIGAFDGGYALTFTYTSRPYFYPDPVALSIVRVQADSYPVEIEIFTDNGTVSRGKWDIPDNQPHRLPGGYRAKDFMVKVRGDDVVSGVYLSDSMAEIV